MTNKRKIYLELFNLNESSSLDDVKKRYRELAKEFHPDRNKDRNAHERFLLIKEAYEYLLSNQTQNLKSVYFENINLEKERIEKIRIAKEKLREFYRKKELERKKYIISFYKSKLWKSYIVLSIICLIYSVFNLTDFILPKKELKTIILEVSENYNGITEDQITLIKPKTGKSFFISSEIKGYFKQNDSIVINKSLLLNKTFKTELKTNLSKLNFKTINNNILFTVFLSLMLIIPFIKLIKNKKEIEDIFISRLLLSVYLPLIIYLLVG